MNPLVAPVALSVTSGILYAYMGTRLGQRRVSAQARPAQLSFALWWFALALTSFLSAAEMVLYMAGSLSVAIYEALTQALLLAIMGGLAGLLYYLVYLYTGARRSWIPLAIYYVALFVLLEWLILSLGRPVTITDDGWALKTLPQPTTNAAFAIIFLVLFIGPQLAAAMAYALLYRRATDNTQRYRIGLVSGSIIVWFGSSFFTAATGTQGKTLEIFSQVLSLLAAMTILLAYQPIPAWKKRWGLRSIADENGSTASTA
jgi:hypothetical protein